MSDLEDYNSEEDADYVPSDGELGSEEEYSGEEEDLSVLADDADTGPKKTGRKKQKKNNLAPRKRKGGIRLQEGTPADETNGDTENDELAQKIKEEDEQKKVEKEKKRADDLWSSFLTDVKHKAKTSPKPMSSSSGVDSGNQDASRTTLTAASAKTNGSSKVIITQVFDFAGEEIKVTREVASDSKEARAELKKQEQLQQEAGTSSSPAAANTAVPPAARPMVAGPAVEGTKRPSSSGGGLGSVLNKIGKKQKMGTLEKSKMDWDSFKKKEGIEEDLKIHNKGKDGYIERVSFLNRVDLRQFEIERDIRLSRSGKR